MLNGIILTLSRAVLKVIVLRRLWTSLALDTLTALNAMATTVTSLKWKRRKAGLLSTLVDCARTAGNRPTAQAELLFNRSAHSAGPKLFG